MKKLLFLLLVSSATYAEYKETYKCEKGSKVIWYRLAYKTEKEVPPCKVYEKYMGQKTKRIANSVRTKGVCEEVWNRILERCTSQGMSCTKETDERENL